MHFSKYSTTDQAQSHKNESLWYYNYISAPLNIIHAGLFYHKKITEESIHVIFDISGLYFKL